MSRLKDLTGQSFGYWQVIERAENDKGGKARWKCLCTACGTEKIVSGSHLRSGNSTNCGCVRMEKMRQSQIKEETGHTYGFLYVNRQATKEELPRTDTYGVYWNCTCLKCGRENVIVKGDYLRNGDTKSCGCISSMNESLISQMLDAKNIPYKTQFMFNDLTPTGRACDRLMFDFAIFQDARKIQLSHLIEYDGSQHFNKSSFHGAFTRTHPNDLAKNQYCFDNRIPLIRIPYDVEYTPDDLMLNTTRFLFSKEKELSYYDLRLKD